MLYPWQHRTFPSIVFFCQFTQKDLQIKYLRIPDTLLDAVKDEQNRAREAGRSARGAHVSGGNRGGMPIRFIIQLQWSDY